MSHLISSKDELNSYLELLNLIKKKGTKSNRYLELLNVLVAIEFSKQSHKSFLKFQPIYLSAVGDTALNCWNRAIRVYTTEIDRMSKPSYYKRLKMYKDIYNGKVIVINQIDNIIFELANKPKHSLLTFSIFSPVDLINKKRPGYVPCPISGDFKFRKNKLELSIFFRSHDALNFFVADVYHLRNLQQYVLRESKKYTKHKTLLDGNIGTLNLYFSRVYIPLRMEMKKKEYINGPEIESIFNKLITDLKSFI